MKTPSNVSLKRAKVDNATLERGQATLPNLQITVRSLGFSHSPGTGWVSPAQLRPWHERLPAGPTGKTKDDPRNHTNQHERVLGSSCFVCFRGSSYSSENGTRFFSELENSRWLVSLQQFQHLSIKLVASEIFVLNVLAIAVHDAERPAQIPH